MKSSKNRVNNALIATIALYNFLIFAPIMGLHIKTTPQMQQTRRMMFQQMIQKHQSGTLLGAVWVRTNDEQLTSVDRREIAQLEKLHDLLTAQKGENSQINPLNASMLSKDDLSLLLTALNKLSSGEFDEYYHNLEREYAASQTNKNIGTGQLRRLMTLAGNVKAQGLSTLLASYFLPNDMQRFLMIPEMVNPVIEYLKTAIIGTANLHKTILAGHTGKVTAASMRQDGDGKVFATCADGDTNNLILWDSTTGKMLKTITVPGGNVKDVAINHDGSKAITRAKIKDENKKPERTLILWNTLTGKQIKTLDIPQGMTDAQFSPDGTRIIVEINPDVTFPKTEKSYVCIVDGNTGDTLTTHELADVTQHAYCTVDPKSNTFLIEGESTLYNLTTGAMIKRFDGPTHPLYGVSYSADGTKIIYADVATGNVFIWGGKTGRELARLNITNAICAILNSDGTKMLVSDLNNGLFIWDVITQTQIYSMNGGQTEIGALAFSPDGTIAVSAGAGEHNIILWDTNTGKQLSTLDGHPGIIDEIEFSTDGYHLQVHTGATVVEEDEENKEVGKCTVTLFDIPTGKLIHTFVETHELLKERPDFLSIISSDNNNNHNFILWTPFTNEERAAFVKIEKNLTLQQARLLYQLYAAQLSGTRVSARDNAAFATLPPDVQSMVKKYLMSS